ncbi:ATP phosphoribosyltransferase regulatory subunit [Aciduricibacillus chroicocephali]|uniref:ATP phosphoribosyltransferase regulatory subunit n=1 Tax=Aciduricibacillus chroicocephali TaxID=3054939 RepID=A0ABY9KZV1_9BACI|nr:ATP phosphoribosyltransferase regulatory subunit [Bacillaceae bacterium 44XB]
MEVQIHDPQDPNIRAYKTREQLIQTMKQRFSLHGYNQIRTSTFEPYELYINATGTIHTDEMIKMIDQDGKVLVLRPDITIPITRELAAQNFTAADHTRYFYVSDVFRNSFDGNGSKEKTQAGIECFGEKSPEIDAEAIVLAIQTLKDLDVANFKLEIGHADFFKQVANEMNLDPQEFEQLEKYIQAKNMTEIGPFLEQHDVRPEVAEAANAIPLLYGNPKSVIADAEKYALNDTMKAALQNLSEVYGVIEDYGLADYVVLDFGLINHMDYYSDIIFQGFIDNVAKPVLMGGRYDHLSEQFNARIPAIGFAFDVEALLEGTKESYEAPAAVDMTIIYEASRRQEAFFIAGELRDQGLSTIVVPAKAVVKANSQSIIQLTENKQILLSGDEAKAFNNIDDLKEIL